MSLRACPCVYVCIGVCLCVCVILCEYFGCAFAHLCVCVGVSV